MTRNRSKQATPGRRSSTPSASNIHKRMTLGDPAALAAFYGIEVHLTKPKTHAATEPRDNYEMEN